jgi:putative FmdB family regulatory protein
MDMPIYEFLCNGCGAKASLYFRSMKSDAVGVCEKCGSTDLRRLFSSFRVLRTAFNPASVNKAELLDGINYTDPGSMATFFRRMKDTFQDGPDEHMDEVVQRLDYGEPVEKALDLDMQTPGEHTHAEE